MQVWRNFIKQWMRSYPHKNFSIFSKMWLPWQRLGVPKLYHLYAHLHIIHASLKKCHQTTNEELSAQELAKINGRTPYHNTTPSGHIKSCTHVTRPNKTRLIWLSMTSWRPFWIICIFWGMFKVFCLALLGFGINSRILTRNHLKKRIHVKKQGRCVFLYKYDVMAAILNNLHILKNVQGFMSGTARIWNQQSHIDKKP